MDLTLAVNVFGTKIKKFKILKVIWIFMVFQLSSIFLDLWVLLTQLYDGKMEKGWRPEYLTSTDLHILMQYEDACTTITWIKD